jgi:choline kinase
MKCIILGDKYQKGMKSKGCPGLIKINRSKYNILENQYTVLTSLFGNIDIIYIYGFDNKKFVDYVSGSDIELKSIYNDKYNKYGNVFSLSLAQSFFNDDIIIIDGYKIMDKKIFKKFNIDGQSQIFISNTQGDNQPGCIINEKNIIESFSFDLTNTIADIHYLNKDCATIFGSLVNNSQNYNNFIFEILNKMIDLGFVLKPLVVS